MILEFRVWRANLEVGQLAGQGVGICRCGQGMISGYIAARVWPAACDGAAYMGEGCVLWWVGGRIVYVVVVEGNLFGP